MSKVEDGGPAFPQHVAISPSTDWQTMESAPKDGKPFVAWSVTIMDSFASPVPQNGEGGE
jgi:hypothetical protein